VATTAPKSARRDAPAIVSARLSDYAALEAQANGTIVVCVEGLAVGVGTVSLGAAQRVPDLRTGLPLTSLASDGSDIDRELDRLVRRLASYGLMEYRLARSKGGRDQVVIEPQLADYWPRTPPLADDDVLVLSRFAYIRRRGDAMVLESPRAGALFRLCDPQIAGALANLATPQQIKRFRGDDGFPGLELLALLVDCNILFKIDAVDEGGLRAAEGDDGLVLWDFHDLLFHARSSPGRQANPSGGLYPYVGIVPSLPAVRPRWPGETIHLPAMPPESLSPVARLLRERHSTRSYDDARPITLVEVSRFLDSSSRVLSTWSSGEHPGEGTPAVEYAVRPYPSAGASYELELYLAVHRCDGLASGFYHYDAGRHALVAIGARRPECDALVQGCQDAMGAAAPPQVVITIAARFGRVSWKYSSLAYALILKDAGVLTQTFYTIAADMQLGGCAIGSVNIDLFAKMTGIEFHIEGPVGQFAIGRIAASGANP
jgi:SagB-type dehydrogenase family enzyme